MVQQGFCTFISSVLTHITQILCYIEEQAAADSVAGQVKLDLRYSEQDRKLSIMVQHVRELVSKLVS